VFNLTSPLSGGLVAPHVHSPGVKGLEEAAVLEDIAKTGQEWGKSKQVVC
jgi:hypothetical protein